MFEERRAASVETLPALIGKRQSTISYIKRCLQGKAHWLNVVKFTDADINSFLEGEDLRKRSQQFFLLGASVGRIIDYPKGSLVVRALAQLLEEYEHHLDRVEKRGLEPKAEQEEAKGQASIAPMLGDNLNLPVKASLKRVGRRVVYEYLDVSRVALGMELDYIQVTVSLLDVLTLCYARLDDESCRTPQIAEAALRCDKLLMEHVVSRLCTDLTEIATPKLKTELLAIVEGFDDGSDASSSHSRRTSALRRNAIAPGASRSSIFVDDVEQKQRLEELEEEDDEASAAAAAAAAAAASDAEAGPPA